MLQTRLDQGNLDPKEVATVLRRLLDEGPAPESFGYSCSNCFQRRLSDLLKPLRMRCDAAPSAPRPVQQQRRGVST